MVETILLFCEFIIEFFENAKKIKKNESISSTLVANSVSIEVSHFQVNNNHEVWFTQNKNMMLKLSGISLHYS